MSRTKGPSLRKTKSRYSGDTVLIVCEGTQTEPNYLMELKGYLEIDQAALDIIPSSGSAPVSVVKYAKEEISKACAKGNPYAKVYCVIDKDTHLSYTSALADVKNFNESSRKNPCKTVLCVIPSVPCFEYWILMHYTASTSVFGTGSSSPCQHLINTALRAQVPGYKKADRIFSRKIIEEKLDIARQNSAITLRSAVSAATDDPSSKMHLLIDELEILKNNKYFTDEQRGCL
ncbi:MAG: RloB family protein [Sulfurimonas sp.]|nr:RloB family protein [Sulfurimonas sp.]